MSQPSKRLLAAELARRLTKEEFTLEKHLFKEQLDFVNDPARFATAVCSVRAGKTVACAADLMFTASTRPGSTGLYVTLARSSAKRIVWPELKAINTNYELKGRPNESELSIAFSNGSHIYCFGAGDVAEIEKIRGLSNVALVYLDESQAFRSHIKELVEDIVTKRLYDTNGRCRMIGTPGPVPAGYFYEASQSAAWSHHAWTLHQNPWITKKSGKTVEELIEDDCKRKGVTLQDPSIRRECFGEWVLDSDSLVFRYERAKNNYVGVAQCTDYVLGVDVGLRDADAIAVLGWSKTDGQRRCYLVEELRKAEQDITALASQLEVLIAKYAPLKVVMDTGGLGAKVAEELRKRYSLPIVAAEKTRKYEFISLLNDALRNGRLLAKDTSRFAQDCRIVEWDLDRCTSDRMVMKDEPHSDICDAVLYAFRESLHWLSEQPRASQSRLTAIAWAVKSREMAEEALQKQIEKQERDAFELDAEQMLDAGLEDDPLRYYLNKRKGNL